MVSSKSLAIIAGALVVIVGLVSGFFASVLAWAFKYYSENELDIWKFYGGVLTLILIYLLFLRKPQNYTLELQECMESLSKSDTPAYREFYHWYRKGWLVVDDAHYTDYELNTASLGVWLKKIVEAGTVDVPNTPFLLFDAKAIPNKFSKVRVLIYDQLGFQNALAKHTAKNLGELNLKVRSQLSPRQEILGKIERGEIDPDSPEARMFMAGVIVPQQFGKDVVK